MDQCILALGFFDGVHLGHGALLRRTRALADELRLPAAALTFDTHPAELVRGQRVALLNTPREREMLMRERYGIDEVLTLHFDRGTMAQPWQSFVRDTVCGRFGAVHTVCGEDFRFGAGGRGTAALLQEECARLGVGCDCIAQVRMDGAPISSTRIRALLEAGETAEAVRLLGHPHLLTGTVTQGKKLGRTLGIPTANLVLPDGILVPRFGVYAANAVFEGQTRRAVVNIGTRPTVNGQNVTVEPWILDFDGDLYGHELCLELWDFLRPERKFGSLEELKAEILRNAEQVKHM
ncbi:MAG: riboflavin biosynthesis protein RibF [Oscillospiraceae bacterium]|nr:riboflavin biosynthesis protein RibF [Oscillospiraceae bacterium]